MRKRNFFDDSSYDKSNGYPTYQDDFDKAMDFTLEYGFPEQEDEDYERDYEIQNKKRITPKEFEDGFDFGNDDTFSKLIKTVEDERYYKVAKGDQKLQEDDMFFTRIKNMPDVYGSIFGDFDTQQYNMKGKSKVMRFFGL